MSNVILLLKEMQLRFLFIVGAFKDIVQFPGKTARHLNATNERIILSRTSLLAYFFVSWIHFSDRLSEMKRFVAVGFHKISVHPFTQTALTLTNK